LLHLNLINNRGTQDTTNLKLKCPCSSSPPPNLTLPFCRVLLLHAATTFLETSPIHWTSPTDRIEDLEPHANNGEIIVLLTWTMMLNTLLFDRIIIIPHALINLAVTMSWNNKKDNETLV